MKLFHYSARPLESVQSLAQQGREYNFSFQGFKPRGLWLSVDDAWLQWCQHSSGSWAMFQKDFKFRTQVKLRPSAHIRLIKDTRGFDRFNQRYGCDQYYIDWGKVAEKYQGIIIAPYLYSRRLHLHSCWYYGWDCASGCIWDADAIASLKSETFRPGRP